MTNNPLTKAFLLCLFTLSLVAQDIGYYKNIADTTTNNLLKLESIDSVLIKSYNIDNNTFITYSQTYINLALESDNIVGAAKKAMNLQYPLTMSQNNPEKAVSIIDRVLSKKQKIKDSFLLGGLYLKRGAANSNLDLKAAIADFNMALENFAINDSIHRADVYLFRGYAYSDLGDFVDAGNDYSIAYSYYEALKDYNYMLRSQQGKIIMFSVNGFYDLAKKNRDELITKLIELDLKEFLASEYYNQALDYEKIGNSKLQIESLYNAERHLSDTLKGNMFINIHAALAEYYSSNNLLSEAKQQIDILENCQDKILGNHSIEINYYGAMASYLVASSDLDKSLYFAQKKLQTAEELGIKNEIMSSHLLLSEIYRKLKDYERSLEYKDQYDVMRDSLYTRSNANSLAYYQSLFDIQLKEKELVEKNVNIQLLKKDGETYKNLMFFISLAIMLFFSLILVFRNRQNIKSKKELQEKFSQTLLVSQEAERKRISKDLHDGIGQQLLLIKNKLVSSGDQGTMEMIDSTIEEVRNISHDLHPFVLQEFGITRAIEHTIRQIDENSSLFISSEIDNIDNLFSTEEEVNIYRIVQESFSNILKHAQAEASKVLIKRFSKSIIISIKDNGIGFDFTEKYQDKKSLGLKTLLERTKFLNGHMKVISKKESGTLLEFKLPLQ